MFRSADEKRRKCVIGRAAARQTRAGDLDRERERTAPSLESLIDEVITEANQGALLDRRAHFSDFERCPLELGDG